MARQQIVGALARRDYPPGCEPCGAEVAVEGRSGAFLEQFDHWERLRRSQRIDSRWPIRMDFNLSSSCNLQCVQCNGGFSTAIRAHRERLPPLPKPYDDRFFEDVRAFIPQLRHAAFAGGEPFLGIENFRMWDLIAEIAPHLDVTICTNATQWNSKVVDVLTRLRPQMIFSVDGFTKSTYESIRVGADHGEVMANIERFAALTAANGRTMDINFCLMPQNFSEAGDMALFAESRGMHFNVSITRGPEHCSLAHLRPEELRAVANDLRRQSDRIVPQLRLNRSKWIKEVARVQVWAREAERRDIREYGAEVTVRRRAPELSPERARGLAQGFSDDDVMVVGVGPGDEIVTMSSDLQSLLDLRGAPSGDPLASLQDRFEDKFGPMRSHTVEEESAHHTIATVNFGEIVARVILLRNRSAEAGVVSELFLGIRGGSLP